MEILLAVIAVVIIIAIVGLVMFKKKQQQALEDSEPSVIPQSFDNTQSSAGLDDFFDNRPTPQAPTPPADPLVAVETLIGGQRYDEAATELKRILLSNPSNVMAMVKMLQVYAMTNNYEAFERLHQKVHEMGDTVAIEQADAYRLLIEDELNALKAPAQPAPSLLEPEPLMGDDFDFMADTTSTPASQPAPASQESAHKDSLDFEGFGLESFDEPAPVATKAQSTSDDLDFGLSFDSTPAPIAKPAETALDLGGEFDLGFDTPSEPAKSEPVAAQDEFNLGGDFDFGGDLSFDDKPVQTTTQVTTQATTQSQTNDLDFGLGDDLGGDLSFGLDDKPASTATQTSSDTGLDFDFGGDLGLDSGLDTSSTTASTQTQAKDDDLLGGFDFDSTPTSQTVSDTASYDNIGDELDSLFGAKADATNEISTTPVQESSDFAFDFDSTPAQPAVQSFVQPEVAPQPAPVATPVKDELEFGDFGLGDFGTDIANEPVVSEPVTPAVETPKASTEFSLDNSLAFGDLDLSAPATPITQATSDDLGVSFDTDLGVGLQNTSLQDSGLQNSGLQDNGLQFGDIQTQSTPATPTSSLVDDLAFDDSFGMDLTATPSQPSADVVAQPTVSTDFGLDEDILAKPVVSEPVATPSVDFGASEIQATSVAPAMAVASTVATGGLMDNLDSAGITLELANQYLSLGEHDSAKRLLEEVAVSGSYEQKQVANQLLRRVS